MLSCSALDITQQVKPMKRAILIAGIAQFLLLTAASAKGPFLPGMFVLPNPPTPENGDVGVPYGGVVKEITQNSIKIQWTVQWVPSPNVKPKTFLLSATLAAGKVPMEPRPRAGTNRRYSVLESAMYRITDVKVGDGVSIWYARINGIDICDHICIKKRPGDRVPRLPVEAEALRKPKPIPGVIDAKLIEEKYIRWDEFINAYWDLEDKGIPYPEKFGENRRWPIAPMPRAAGTIGPVISQ